MALKLKNLNELWGAPISEGDNNLEQPVGKVCTDSRKLVKGDFFVPLVGGKFDGHKFLTRVFSLGAQAAVVSRHYQFPLPKGLLHWVVDDTVYAYQQLGLIHRCDLDVPVVAVTGSVGKTTTREMIRSALESIGKIMASSENNNNDIGVPLTLLKGNSTHAAFVVEMGMRGLGEIERLSTCSQPDIAVITNIGSAHIGLLGSRRQIAKAKCEITSALKPNGVVVIPFGDHLLEEVLAHNWTGRVVRVGLDDDELSLGEKKQDLSRKELPKADLVGSIDVFNNEIAIENNICHLPLLGRHNARNFMLAIAVARELNVPWDYLKDLSVPTSCGRNRICQFGRLTVLDETYNASPEAVNSALELLVSYPGRHFAVLGKMLELGSHSVALHQHVAERVVRLGLDGLVVVADGAEADAMTNAAHSLAYFAVVSSPEKAMQPLLSWLKAGDVLLLKASRAVSLEILLPWLAEHQF